MKDKLKVFQESDFVVCSLPGTCNVRDTNLKLEYTHTHTNRYF